MGLVFNVYSNFLPQIINVQVGDPSSLGGVNYYWSNSDMADVIASLGKSGFYSLQDLRADASINPYAAYFPGQRTIDASKFLSLVPDTSPYNLDDWMGYTGSDVLEPFVQDNSVLINFSTTGFKDFTFIMNQGEVNWESAPIQSEPSTSKVHVFNENSLTFDNPSQLCGSANVAGSSVVVSCSDNISTPSTQTKNYYGWFGRIGAEKNWRPRLDKWSKKIVWNYQQPTYLRDGYLDTAGYPNIGIVSQRGAYSAPTAGTQSLTKSGGLWYYTANNVSLVFNDSGYPGGWRNALDYASSFDLYARRNSGVWTTVSSNILWGFCSYSTGSPGILLPWLLNDVNEIIDILWIINLGISNPSTLGAVPVSTVTPLPCP